MSRCCLITADRDKCISSQSTLCPVFTQRVPNTPHDPYPFTQQCFAMSHPGFSNSNLFALLFFCSGLCCCHSPSFSREKESADSGLLQCVLLINSYKEETQHTTLVMATSNIKLFTVFLAYSADQNREGHRQRKCLKLCPEKSCMFFLFLFLNAK